MPDVTIKRCRVRVRRRGGWSWGMPPRAVADHVVRVLPALLERWLAAHLPEDADGEIAASVQIRFTLGREELRAAVACMPAPEGQTPARGTALEQKLGEALQWQLLPHFDAFHTASTPPARDGQRMPSLLNPPSEGMPSPVPTRRDGMVSALERMLLGWRERGRLGFFLRLLTPAALACWHETLRPRASTSVVGQAEDENEFDAIAEEVLRLPAVVAGTPPLRLRLVLAVEIAFWRNLAIRDVRIWRVINRHLPESRDAVAMVDEPILVPTHSGASLPTSPPSAEKGDQPPRSEIADAPPKDLPALPTSDTLRNLEAGATHTLSAATQRQSPPPAPFRGEVHVETALPFLLVGPLAQIGYLDAVAGGLEALNAGRLLPAWAFALARKVLPPPARGGLRTPGAQAVAAAFAGREQPLPETDLAELARLADDLAAVPDAVAAQALVEGHPAGQPLLIIKTVSDRQDGWLLVDATGVFPIAPAQDFPALLTVLRLVETEPLFLPADAAAPDVLQRLHEEGFRFLTDAPPARGEPWQPVRRGAARWWTNGPPEQVLKHLSRTERIQECAESARQVWHALAAERLSVPLAVNHRLEQSLGLAAALALGQIAWTLWGQNEATDPLLTLERLSSLDARVQFRADTVRVVLPLGRRSADLAAGGFLEDVPEVPWLDGRVLTFARG